MARGLAIAALVIIPLAHNPAGWWIYELPKETALWLFGAGSLALLALRPPALAFQHRAAAVTFYGLLTTAIIALLATGFGVDQTSSFFGVDPRFDGFLAHLSFFLLFLLFLRAFTNRLFDVVAAIGAMMATYALGQAVVGAEVVSTSGNAMMLGSFLVLSIPLTVASQCSGSSVKRRALTYTSLALQLAAVAVANARSAWLALAVMGVLYTLYRWRSWPQRGIVIASLCLLGLVIGALIVVAGSASLYSLRERIVLWRTLPAVYSGAVPVRFGDPWPGARFWLGFGPDMYGVVYQRVQPVFLTLQRSGGYLYDRPHNDYVLRFVEMGALGLLTYVVALGGAVWSAIKQCRQPAAAWAGLALVGHIVDMQFAILSADALVLLALALAACIAPFVRQSRAFEGLHYWSCEQRFVLRALPLLAGGLLAWQAALLPIAEQQGVRAAGLPSDAVRASQMFEKAADMSRPLRFFFLRYASLRALEAGQGERAVALAEESTRAQPLHATGYRFLGNVYLAVGREPQGVAYNAVADLLWPHR